MVVLYKEAGSKQVFIVYLSTHRVIIKKLIRVGEKNEYCRYGE